MLVEPRGCNIVIAMTRNVAVEDVRKWYNMPAPSRNLSAHVCIFFIKGRSNELVSITEQCLKSE
jgi:hypothetical protein